MCAGPNRALPAVAVACDNDTTLPNTRCTVDCADKLLDEGSEIQRAKACGSMSASRNGEAENTGSATGQKCDKDDAKVKKRCDTDRP